MHYEDRAVPPPPPPFGETAGERLKSETEGLGSLVSGVVSDLQELVRGEIALARTEIKEDAQAAGKAVGAMAAGGVLALVGFVFLMLAATYALALVLPLWASALIVAVFLLIVGAVAALWGKKQLDSANLGPDQTIESLKEDSEWAKRQINSVKK
jgi:uncharacterized membrane protein YqjE